MSLPPDPAALIATIEPIDFRPHPERGDEYNAWVTAVLGEATRALEGCGLTTVRTVALDMEDELEHQRAEGMLVGQVFVVSGTSGIHRSEALALVHFADGRIRISTSS